MDDLSGGTKDVSHKTDDKHIKIEANRKDFFTLSEEIP